MADDKPRSNLVWLLILIVVVLLIGLAFYLCSRNQHTAAGSRGGRVATILAVNDIYRVDGVGKDEIGGLHRLRTLRNDIEKKSGKVLLLHAGDFLSPSLEGRVFKGEHMVDAMNNLDGDPKKFDARMFVAFGNHEFDDSKCGVPVAPLPARVEQSQFTWLVSNLDFSNCASMKTIPALKNVKRTAIVDINGVKIGLFSLGLTGNPKDSKSYPATSDSYDSARAAIKELRDKKADVVVALTHLDRHDDEMLLRSLSEHGLDLLIGGHDHEKMEIKDALGIVRGFKADSDAKTAWEVEVRVQKGGRPVIVPKKLNELDQKIAADPAIDKLAKKWTAEAEAKLCADRHKAGREPDDIACLRKLAGKALFPIELEEKENRGSETEFGRWLASEVRKVTKADVAIVHSGMLGLNTNLAANSDLQYKQIVDIFRFDDYVAVRSYDASDVCDAIRHGFSRAGTGAWPHIYGASPDGPDKDAADPKVKWKDIKIELADPRKVIGCEKGNNVRVAGVAYLLCGGDEYPLMAKDGVDAKSPEEKNSKCLAGVAKDPTPGETARYISLVAEDAVREASKTGGIKAPPPIP